MCVVVRLGLSRNLSECVRTHTCCFETHVLRVCVCVCVCLRGGGVGTSVCVRVCARPFGCFLSINSTCVAPQINKS